MRIATLIPLGLLLACGDKGGDSTTPTGTTGTTTGSTTTGTTGSYVPDPDKSATLQGKVYDCSGVALESAQLRFCDVDACTNATSESDGSYSFPNELYGWNSLEVLSPAGADLMTTFAPIEVGDGEVRDLDISLCPHEGWNSLSGTATELELGTGLHITLSTSLIEKPTPFDEEPTQAAGLHVATANWVPTDGITGTVVAQYFLMPFNYQATAGTGLDYRVGATAAGLTAASYHVYVGSYDDFAWLDAGTISDGDSDGYYTPDGDGLPHLGTVLIVEE